MQVLRKVCTRYVYPPLILQMINVPYYFNVDVHLFWSYCAPLCFILFKNRLCVDSIKMKIYIEIIRNIDNL